MTGPMTADAYVLAATTAAAAAAVATGLLAAIHAAPADAATLARRAGCDALAAERVLAVLVAAGVLEREGGAYVLGAALREVDATSPGGLAAFVALYGHAPRFLRDGTRVGAMDGSPAARGAAYAGTVGDLGRLFHRPAAALAERLPVPARQILDLGAGSGVWSLAMAARAAATHVTAVDLPEVLPAFAARAATLGLADRITRLPGDFHSTPLPHGFDRVVLANVLHLEPADRAASLIARAAAALRPGGDLVVVDVFAEVASGPPAHAAYELHLAMRTGGGRAHPAATINDWLNAAGCTSSNMFDLSDTFAGLGALVARPPGD